MITKSVIHRGRVRAIEDAVEAWKASHDDALEVRDLEDVVREWLWATDLLLQWQNECWKELVSRELKRPLEMGRLLRIAYKASLDVLTPLTEYLEWAEGKGFAVDRAAEFRARIQELQQLQTDFLRRWPFPDRPKIEAAVAALDHGEGVDLGGWIRELQGDAGAGS